MIELSISENNHTFHGYECGNRNLPTLVCLHGMTGDSNSFIELVNFLTDDFHLILLDNPGHGKTEPFTNEEDYTFSSVARRLDKVINRIVDKPFYMMGHSWGADLALNYAKIFPDRVKGIILVDGGYVFPEQVEGLTEEKAVLEWAQYIRASSYRSWEEIVTLYQNYTTREWDKTLDSIIYHNFKRNSGNYVLKVDSFSILATIKAFYNEPCSTTYSSIKCPVLLFHATFPDNDPSRNKGIQKIKSNMKDLKVVGIKNTKHNIHWDRPNILAKELIQWKKEQGY